MLPVDIKCSIFSSFSFHAVPPYLLPVGVAMLIIVALIFAALLLVGVKRRQR